MDYIFHSQFVRISSLITYHISKRRITVYNPYFANEKSISTTRIARRPFNSFDLKMSSNSSSSQTTLRSSLAPPNPSTHETSRQEITYIVELCIRATLRQTFLREELVKAEQVHIRRTSGTSNNIQFMPDMEQIRQVIIGKVRAQRSWIKRQARFFESLLYKRATTMKEYYNVEDLRDRLDEVGRLLNARISR